MNMKVSDFNIASNMTGRINIEKSEEGYKLISSPFSLKDLCFKTLSKINSKLHSKELDSMLKNYHIDNQKAVLQFLNALAKEKSVESTFSAYEAAKSRLQHSFTGKDIKTMLNAADRFHGIGTAKNLERHLVLRCWNYEGADHWGHTSVSVKNNMKPEPSHMYLSWYPLNNSTKITSTYFSKSLSTSTNSYRNDKLNMLSDRTVQRLNAGEVYKKSNEHEIVKTDINRKDALYPRANQKKDIDQASWGVSANKIYIPLQGENQSRDGGTEYNLFGLDESKLSSFICKKRGGAFRRIEHYKLISKSQNCAGMALDVLKAGDAETYVPFPKIKLVANPNDAYKYAYKVMARIEELNKIHKGIIKNVDEKIDIMTMIKLRRSYLNSFNKVTSSHKINKFNTLLVIRNKDNIENASLDDYNKIINSCFESLKKLAPHNSHSRISEFKPTMTDTKEQLIEKSIKIIDFYQSLKNKNQELLFYTHDLLLVNKTLLDKSR
ncbi:virulence factor (plasmid) [Escherichia coli]|nr:virulence factor [Escherichia coli]EHX4454108.1 virulence factor [Escherichia coli]QMQ25086.1 virulence factor [Escherichia coli]